MDVWKSLGKGKYLIAWRMGEESYNKGYSAIPLQNYCLTPLRAKKFGGYSVILGKKHRLTPPGISLRYEVGISRDSADIVLIDGWIHLNYPDPSFRLLPGWVQRCMVHQENLALK